MGLAISRAQAPQLNPLIGEAHSLFNSDNITLCVEGNDHIGLTIAIYRAVLQPKHSFLRGTFGIFKRLTTRFYAIRAGAVNSPRRLICYI
jgi:hypothetical protein